MGRTLLKRWTIQDFTGANLTDGYGKPTDYGVHQDVENKLKEITDRDTGRRGGIGETTFPEKLASRANFDRRIVHASYHAAE